MSAPGVPTGLSAYRMPIGHVTHPAADRSIRTDRPASAATSTESAAEDMGPVGHPVADNVLIGSPVADRMLYV